MEDDRLPGPPPDPHATLRDSWDTNAAAWTDSVRSGSIASRRLGTDRAAVEAVRHTGAQHVLDVGGGEGWLARALADDGRTVAGFDGSADLVAAAQQQGSGHFFHLTYEDAAADPTRLGGPYDAAVANFALLGDDLGGLLAALHAAVGEGGHLVVQTLHPLNVEPPYVDGWRVETFAGMGTDGGPAYAAPMPWYFRTTGGWLRLLNDSGWRVVDLVEPPHPETGRPLSLVLTARRDG